MLRPWLLAARPKTLFASVCPVIIGASLAEHDGVLHLPAAFAALLGAMSIQVGTNYCNDYFDFRQGADTESRKGPTRAVQAGLVTPRSMLIATFAAFTVTAIACIYLVARAGLPLALLGVVSVGCGVWYTASRFSLAYLGLGDIFVLVFFGPVAVAGTHYVQSLEFSKSAAFTGLAPGLLAVAILVVNNLRDIAEDAVAQKRTLAVRFGAQFARFEYLGCMVGAATVPVVMWLGLGHSTWVLLATLGVAPGFAVARKIQHLSGAALNPMLGQTALVLLLFTAIISTVCIVT